MIVFRSAVKAICSGAACSPRSCAGRRSPT